MQSEFVIPAPSDYHLHLRQGYVTEAVAQYSKWCGRVLVMPNLDPPITTGREAQGVRVAYESHLGPGVEVLPTIKLTRDTTPSLIHEASQQYGVFAAKLYPDGVTTNSHGGIPRDWLQSNPMHCKLYDVLAAMQDCDMVLCCHGEMPGCPTFAGRRFQDRGTKTVAFLDFLAGVLIRFPRLRVVLEHISTADEAGFVAVKQFRGKLAATVTPHHLTRTIDHLLGDTLRPHEFCKPVVKTEEDREALVDCATSGHPSFFLGTDSAPHYVGSKECSSGCAGVFNAHTALGTLAEVFSQAPLTCLIAFTSFNGDTFYRRPKTTRCLKLWKQPWIVAEHNQPQVRMANGTQRSLHHWRSGETVQWMWQETTPDLSN